MSDQSIAALIVAGPCLVLASIFALVETARIVAAIKEHQP